jgi:spermidine synthase
MKWNWRYLKSFISEVVVEEGRSAISPGLQVWYAFGRKMLNTANVNYSFGRLDRVFRSAFHQLKIGERDIHDVLLLGLGAGNVPAILQEYDPGIRVVALEIDPEVLRLAEAHFGLVQGPKLEVILADAIDYVFGAQKSFDMVVVDLFVDDVVPERACTPAFLGHLPRLLRSGGLLIFNRLAHTEGLLRETEAFGRTMMETLPGTRFMRADLNKLLVYEGR